MLQIVEAQISAIEMALNSYPEISKNTALFWAGKISALLEISRKSYSTIKYAPLTDRCEILYAKLHKIIKGGDKDD